MRVGLVLVAVLVCTATVTAGHGVRASPTPMESTLSGFGSPPLAGSGLSHATDGPSEPLTHARGVTAPRTEDTRSQVSEPDSVEAVQSNLTARLQPNGDAAWEIEITIPLAGRNETRAFRDLAGRYESGRAEVGPQVAPFEQSVAAASEGIEREMSLLDVSRSARIENGTGYLTLEFLWTNFATESGDSLRVGDAFSTPRGTWLPGLAANQSLTLVGPPGYGVNSAPIGPDNATLRWDGPQEFDPGYLSVTYRRGLRESTTQTTTTTPPPNSQDGLVPLAAGAVLGVGLLVALYARSRGSTPVLGDDGGDDSTATGTVTDVDVVDGPADDASEPNTATSEELLSDEERVERLLRENGGRMRQAAIVTETRWSNAKVSQLLSSMDAANRIDKLRIGRENLISLPDAETDDADE